MRFLSYKLKYKLNLFRRYPYWDNAGVIFLHVPKAAGTSVNRALYGKTLGHYSALEVQRAFPNLFRRCFSFSLVRNPWDRALSAYRFAKLGATKSMGVYQPEQYHIPQFDTFERFVCEWLPSRNLTNSDFIFRPQYSFVCDRKKRIIVDHLGYVERLRETVSFVERRLGRELDIKVENATNAGSGVYQDAYFSDEMVEIVRSVYADDVSMFGYEF
tara:strand:- start:4911 stop:5555 length:645 start_codon:yes stop_codon:yes gene_type:complete